MQQNCLLKKSETFLKTVGELFKGLDRLTPSILRRGTLSRSWVLSMRSHYLVQCWSSNPCSTNYLKGRKRETKIIVKTFSTLVGKQIFFFLLLTAWSPRQIRDWDEAIDEIEKRPGDDDAVVDVQEEDDRHRGVAHAWNMTRMYFFKEDFKTCKICLFSADFKS